MPPKPPSPSSMASSAVIKFSTGSDEAALRSAVAPLLGRWRLARDGAAIERSFRFKTFAKTWDFMTAVSLQCKIRNHHPEWSNVYNTTFIRWTTHQPAGLSAKDVTMAALCDSLARDFGEQQQQDVPEGGEAPAPPSGDLGKNLVDQVVASTGECGPCSQGPAKTK